MTAESACCGGERATVALRSRADVALCRECLEWLLGRIGVTSTATLPVVDMAAAIEFYERAGFGVRTYDDGFAFVEADGQSVFDLGLEADMDPALNRAGCYLIVTEADAWHDRMHADGLTVTELADQPWGIREFTLTDPSGNHIRIGRAVDEGAAGSG